MSNQTDHSVYSKASVLSYHVPLPIIDGVSSVRNLERVLIFELDFNAATSQPQHKP